MIELIKIPVVSAYYLIHAMFDRWMSWWLAAAWLVAAMTGIQMAKHDREIGNKWQMSFISLGLILYLGLIMLVFQSGGLVAGTYEGILRMIYLIGSFVCVLQMSNKKWMDFQKSRTEYIDINDVAFFRKIRNMIWGILAAGFIPVIAISPYIFPRADDYSFGYKAHLALEQTGSWTEVLKAVIDMIKTAYFGWQGTYSSIFMMAIQPAVFDEKLYRIVPMFFIGIIILTTCFLVKTILADWLQGDQVLIGVCLGAYLLMAIQCIPVKQSAFLWYNGAIHYIGSHCVLLCMMAFIVRIYMGKNVKASWWGAAICAVYVGGGNHVTAISTLLISLTILFLITITKKWKCYKNIGGICVIYLLALAANIVAPGNFNKMGMKTGYGLFQAFFLAFAKVPEYMFGKWMHWTIIAVIVFCIPIIWRMVQGMKFGFSYPALFVGYSWCYMASMFFTPLFTMADVEVGRFQNIMFLQGMLWLLFDIGYVIGWIQKRYLPGKNMSFCIKEKRYMYILGGTVLGMMLLSGIAEPEKYTSIYALNTLRDEQLQEYAKDYWYNIEILETDEKEVTIKGLENIPAFLDPEESDEWHMGLRFFYNKDKIYFEEEE